MSESPSPEDFTPVAAWQVGDLTINVTGSRAVILELTTGVGQVERFMLLPNDARQLGEALRGGAAE